MTLCIKFRLTILFLSKAVFISQPVTRSILIKKGKHFYVCRFDSKQSQEMQHLSKWFLKTRLQGEQLLGFINPDPSQDELQEAVKILRANFPHLSPADLIQVLYKSMRQVADSRIIPPYAQKFKIPNVPPPTFRSQEECDRFLVKQAIIDAFIKRGYGMGPFREHITSIGFDKRVEYKKYAGIITSIATEAFRAMEKFLECHCGILVESLPKPDIRILYSILLNFKEYSHPMCQKDEYFNNFALFLRASYNKAPVDSEVEALSVYRSYQAILRLLMIRAKEVDPVRYDQREKISVFRQEKDRMFCRKVLDPPKANSAPIDLYSVQQENQQENFLFGYQEGTSEGNIIDKESGIQEITNNLVKTWDSQCQDQLAAMYVEQQDMARIRDKYRQIYGCNTMFENVNTLRSYIYKIIRKSLRRAQKIVKVYAGNFSPEVGQVMCLRQDQRYVQYVLTSPELLQARVLLCILHNQKVRNFELLEDIARAMMIGLDSRMGMGRRSRARRY